MYKVVISIVLMYGLSACSASKRAYSWERTKAAAYIAVTDPVTWAPAISGAALDITNYDDDITRHILDKKTPIFTEEEADNLRTFSTAITYTTAVLIKDNNLTLKAKRLVVETAALYTGRGTVTVLNKHVQKKSPNGEYDEAIGSNHAVTPFVSAALTRRNLDQMNIPIWGKYSVNTVSYLAATGSAYQRVEAGLHSVSDQLFSASVGNFIALFIHDAFMADDMQLGIDLGAQDPKVTLSIPF